MEKMFFSVVLPLYNKEKYIAETVKSVLNQSYPNFELLIVDDGSSDHSAEIVKGFQDSRIRYIEQNNQGASVARNHAMQLAKYDYIAFIDGDDLWLHDFLEQMNNLIKKYPDAGAYGCAYLKERVEGDTLELAEKMMKSESDMLITNYFAYSFEHEQTLTASTSVIRKSILDKIGEFPIGLKNWEDLDFWTRVGLYYKVAFTERVCAIYNDVASGASKAVENLHAPVFDNFKKYLADTDVPEMIKKDFKEYVIEHKLFGAYQQYLVDRNKFVAIKKVLPYFWTKRHKKMYISMLVQFVIGPERFLKSRTDR